MRHKIRYFQPIEFRCKCCSAGNVASSLVYHLDLIRGAWGAPLRVNSGFRCERHNREVGGSPKSRHLIGCAADIAPNDAVLAPLLCELVTHVLSDMNGWEVIRYPWGMHVAVPREETATLWTGGAVHVKIS